MKRSRTNRHNVQWAYARACADALRDGTSVPPVPVCSIWEKEEDSTKAEKLVGTQPIEPQKVSIGGTVLFG